MHKHKKEQVINELRDNLSGVSICVVAHYAGLNAQEIVKLRKVARQENFKLRVAKNSLLKLAVSGGAYESLQASFTGPVMIAFSHESDYLSVVKSLNKFAEKSQKLKIMQGLIAGKLVETKEIKELAKLPPFEELRAKLVHTLQGPATQLVMLLQKPSQKLVRALQAREE